MLTSISRTYPRPDNLSLRGPSQSVVLRGVFPSSDRMENSWRLTGRWRVFIGGRLWSGDQRSSHPIHSILSNPSPPLGCDCSAAKQSESQHPGHLMYFSYIAVQTVELIEIVLWQWRLRCWWKALRVSTPLRFLHSVRWQMSEVHLLACWNNIALLRKQRVQNFSA